VDQQGEDLSRQSLLQDLKQLRWLTCRSGDNESSKREFCFEKLTTHDHGVCQVLHSVCDVSLRDQSFAHLNFVQEVALDSFVVCEIDLLMERSKHELSIDSPVKSGSLLLVFPLFLIFFSRS
jgi:hypothetical protein